MTKAVIAGIVLVAGVAAAVKSQAPEVRRYLKVRKM
jgi:hypothetical protein